MIGIKVTAFIDQRKTLAHIERKQTAVLFRLGGFVLSIMRRSIRKRRGSSKPGTPPHSHAGQLRRLMRFAVDKQAGEVVTGPMLFGNKSNVIPASGATIPELLNYGGRASMLVQGGERVMAEYKPRPYVEPAQEKGQERFSKLLETVTL